MSFSCCDTEKENETSRAHLSCNVVQTLSQPTHTRTHILFAYVSLRYIQMKRPWGFEARYRYRVEASGGKSYQFQVAIGAVVAVVVAAVEADECV